MVSDPTSNDLTVTVVHVDVVNGEILGVWRSSGEYPDPHYPLGEDSVGYRLGESIMQAKEPDFPWTEYLLQLRDRTPYFTWWEVLDDQVLYPPDQPLPELVSTLTQ